MKRLVFVPILLFFILSCDQSKNPVAEYGDAMINSYQKGKQAGETGNLDAVRKAVQAYHASNDKYPENLNEIKGMIGSEMDLAKYNYNAQTGEVNLNSR